MEIRNAEAGYLNVANLLERKNYGFIGTIEINNGRYKILKTNKEVFIVVFKKDFFRSFGTIFKDQGESGVGETLNVEDLKDAIGTANARSIIFIYPSGHIYKISVEEFLMYSHKRTVKEGKEVRSINVKHLIRMNPETEAFK